MLQQIRINDSTQLSAVTKRWHDTADRPAAHHHVTAPLTHGDEAEVLQRTNGFRPETTGSSGNVGDVECRDHRPLAGGRRKLFKIELRRLHQIGECLGFGVTLRRRAGLGVQRGVATLRGGRDHGSQFYLIIGSRGDADSQPVGCGTDKTPERALRKEL